jgi:hypothetical protein
MVRAPIMGPESLLDVTCPKWLHFMLMGVNGIII